MAKNYIYSNSVLIGEEDIEDFRPEFPTLSGSGFIALLSSTLGIARVDQLLAKSKTIETLLVKASFVDRNSGNTPTAFAFLMTGANALTTEELESIDTAWKLL